MLKGQAKTNYQRNYMRWYRSNVRPVARPDGCCGVCGRWGVVDEHHKDHDHNNGGDNLIKLCPNCHADIHRRGKALDPVQLKLPAWEKFHVPSTPVPDQLPPGSYIDADGNIVYD